eukprot:gene37965-46843_t
MDDESTDAEKFHDTIQMMARKGLRPITPLEYSRCLNTSKGSGGATIHLWRTFDGKIPPPEKSQIHGMSTVSKESVSTVSAGVASVSSMDPVVSSSQRLPSTREEATMVLDAVECYPMNEERCDSKCTISEWATAY